MSTAIPDSYLCPITRVVMRNPVMDRDGHSYERSAIEEWVHKNHTSPITRQHLEIVDLVVNRGLRDTIEAFLAANPQIDPANPDIDLSLAPIGDKTIPVKPTLVPEAIPVSVSMLTSGSDVVIQIIPPDTPTDGHRGAFDLVCVVDVSGSMNADAPVQDASGQAESHGLSVLDVVSHAVKSVGHMLGPRDRLGIVAFNEKARTELPLTYMNDEGKKTLGEVLGKMTADGATNIWDGQYTAMEMLKASGKRNAAILLLTDGQPNREPPRGHIPALEEYYNGLDGPRTFTVSTFGFGYNLKSDLLSDIARLSNGLYVFIPDAGLVGSVFINTVSNLLATISPSTSVAIQGAPNATNLSEPLTAVGTDKITADIGPLLFGQTRTISFSLDHASLLNVIITLKIGGNPVTLRCADAVETTPDKTAPYRHRTAYQQVLKTITSIRCKDREAVVDQCLTKIEADTAALAGSALLRGLRDDLAGEVYLAVTKKEHLDRWGFHYFPSLVRANILEQCNNFKDKSVANYGGKFFQRLVKEGETCFLSLPPPVPNKHRKSTATGKTTTTTGPTTTTHTAPASPPITSYYNTYGGCVLGETPILLNDGTTLSAESIKQGMKLAGGATVQMVARVHLDVGAELIGVPLYTSPSSHLWITPYHPIRCSAMTQPSEWTFPVTMTGAVRRVVSEPTVVFIFVLDSVHTVTVPGGVEVVTWGHGFDDSDVVRHEFFGSRQVGGIVHKLEQMISSEGVVDVGGFIREGTTNLVVGVLPHLVC